MKYILIAILALASFGASAQDTAQPQNVSAELNARIAQMTDAEKAAALTRLKDPSAAQITSEWVDVGEKLGRGLASTARELGVEANSFAQTPVGKVAIFLLVWNFFGTDLAALAVSAFGVLIMLPLLMIFMYRVASKVHVVEGKSVRSLCVEKLDSGVGFITVFFVLLNLAIIIVPLMTIG